MKKVAKKVVLFLVILLLVGCNGTENDQAAPVDASNDVEANRNDPQEIVIDEEDEGEFFVVGKIVQEEGFKYMYLTSSDEQGSLLPNTTPLGISVSKETLVEMEEGNLDNPIRRGATIEDILEGDLLKLYMRERVEGSVQLENALDRVVIVRLMIDRGTSVDL